MNSIWQWIIVGGIIGAAVVYLATRKKSCDCGDCPLSKNCKKPRKK